VAAAAGPGPSVPGTYTPSSSDVAAWEEKARDAEKKSENPPPAATLSGEDIPGA
jgi:hypothetical protein